MKTGSINRTKLCVGVLMSLLASIAVTGFLVCCLLIMTTIEYGFNWAVKFAIEMLTTNLQTQIYVVAMIVINFSILCLGFANEFFDESLPKPARVKIGNRYLHLKSEWIARKEMPL